MSLSRRAGRLLFVGQRARAITVLVIRRAAPARPLWSTIWAPTNRAATIRIAAAGDIRTQPAASDVVQAEIRDAVLDSVRQHSSPTFQ